ncbi:MAG: hypothetical protein AAGG48_23030 [Planctomycetota bacterium]
MSIVLPGDKAQVESGEPIEHAIHLLSQQVWCWGKDITRGEGNWLLEIGFDRIKPPEDRDECSSVYVLRLPEGRSVILRGFGVYFSDSHRGGVFLPRFQFRPQYTSTATLECPPWSDSDLPDLDAPTDAQRQDCVSLTVELLDWIGSYEQGIADRLGTEYRRSSLQQWDNGERVIIPAALMAEAWRQLSVRVADDFEAYS